jgi:hypothetical protein
MHCPFLQLLVATRHLKSSMCLLGGADDVGRDVETMKGDDGGKFTSAY